MNAITPTCTVSIIVRVPLLIENPKNRLERLRLVPDGTAHQACSTLVNDAPWIVIPGLRAGLPRRQWVRLWHEEKVEIKELRGQQCVGDLFDTRKDPYE